MVRVEFELNTTEVNKIIESEVQIFGNINMLHQVILVPNGQLISKAWFKFNNMDSAQYTMTRYMGYFCGEAIYDFYNVVSRADDAQEVKSKSEKIDHTIEVIVPKAKKAKTLSDANCAKHPKAKKDKASGEL